MHNAGGIQYNVTRKSWNQDQMIKTQNIRH